MGRGAGYLQETAAAVSYSENWGLGFGASGTQPTGNASAKELAEYDAFYIGNADEKTIYLTFDCGYENGNTGAILDALKKHNAKATFFVVGHFLESAPDLVNRMVQEGHTVGNHTYHHPDMSSISTIESFKKELDDVKQSASDLKDVFKDTIAEASAIGGTLVAGAATGMVLSSTAGKIQYTKFKNGARIRL